jgi:hypothetical protein
MNGHVRKLLTRLYYQFKPLVPPPVRWSLRRRRATVVRRRNLETWPIDETAGSTPPAWRGWPEGKRFAFVLTHDVESANGLAKVHNLAEMEMRMNLRSAFNFIPKGSYPVPDDLRGWLTTRGFEVGVHDLHHDGKLYHSRRAFRAKAKQINHHLRSWGAAGFRSGFMLRQLDWLHDLEIDYDASTFDTDPFEPQPQGCGTIFPFLVANQTLGANSGYVELPYTLPQDSTLYLLLGERSPEIWLRKLDWIVQRGGLALVNIHPDYMDFERSEFTSLRYPAAMVADLLGWVCSRYGGEFWNPLPKELAQWYRQSWSKKEAGIDNPGGNPSFP